MLDSRMIAETAGMPNVTGSRSDTPFGAPSPGSTPTRMPSSTPPTISAMWPNEKAIEKPCSRASRFSMQLPVERRAQPAVRQLDLEGALEHCIERHDGDHGDHAGAPGGDAVLQTQGREHVDPGDGVHAEDRDQRDERHCRQEERAD